VKHQKPGLTSDDVAASAAWWLRRIEPVVQSGAAEVDATGSVRSHAVTALGLLTALGILALKAGKVVKAVGISTSVAVPILEDCQAGNIAAWAMGPDEPPKAEK
jgi:hypothetical protein